jgi:uncharacterized protein
MLRLVLCLIALAMPALAQPRPPVAPPCAVPDGPLRATICGDAELRAAEARLRGVERNLATTTARAATLAERARAWQRELEAQAPDRDALRSAYEERIGVLEEALRQDRAMRRLERGPEGRPSPVFPRPANLERSCLGAVLRDCRVTGAGLALSEDGQTRILWQAQRGATERDGVRAGLVLLAEARGGWRLLGWSFEGTEYGAPRIVGTEGPRLVHAPGRGGGSGSANADLLYRLEAGRWQEIETESWKQALPARLPPGLGIWQAVTYDIEGSGASTRLWRAADANCCPSGGTAFLDLRIEGELLVLAGVRLDTVARTQWPAPDACPAERATYRLDAPVEFTAELRGGFPGTGAASDLALRVASAATGREYWFVFAAAQGYGSLSLLPVQPPGPKVAEDGLEPYEEKDDTGEVIGFHPVTAAMEVLPDPPRAGVPAPQRLFMPDLGRALWYGNLPQQSDTQDAREEMPPAFWVLSGCRQE